MHAMSDDDPTDTEQAKQNRLRDRFDELTRQMSHAKRTGNTAAQLQLKPQIEAVREKLRDEL